MHLLEPFVDKVARIHGSGSAGRAFKLFKNKIYYGQCERKCGQEALSSFILLTGPTIMTSWS